jgi:hypothetical protein
MSVPSSWRVLRVTVTNSDGPHAPNPTKRTHATLTAPSQREGQGFESPSTILKLRTNYGPRPPNSAHVNGQLWTPAISGSRSTTVEARSSVKGSPVQISQARPALSLVGGPLASDNNRNIRCSHPLVSAVCEQPVPDVRRCDRCPVDLAVTQAEEAENAAEAWGG